MGANSKIEWTTHTFNPWWGCQRVSPGCEHCYAETFAHRLGYGAPATAEEPEPKPALWGPVRTTARRFFGAKHWEEPRTWNARAAREGVRRRVFCASMADVFDADRRDTGETAELMIAARQALYATIEATPMLDWLLLTKRPQNVLALVPAEWLDGQWPLNAWIGTTVESQEYADQRIPHLLRIPAPVRFLSCEPLLGPVDLPYGATPDGDADDTIPGIHWVIAGGESGHGARPMHPDWARSLRDQCQEAGVPFFFKQWGEWATEYDRDADDPDWQRCDVVARSTPRGRWMSITGGHGFHGSRVVRINRAGTKAAGRELDGRTWDEFPSLEHAR